MSEALARRLSERIRVDGPIRFDRFQEAALYDADGGYYERPGRVGRQGDFVTAAAWHPAFGRCVARLLERVGAALRATPGLLDVGAGEGELLSAVAGALPPGGGLALWGVERSKTRRRRAEAVASGARLFEDLDAVPAAVRGVVVAYELFDAIPVRALVAREDGSLRERVVDLDEGERFVWREVPCPDGPRIAAELARRGARPAPGQRLEVREGAAALARSVARALGEGILLVFDYGARTPALLGPARFEGTLEAFRGHGVSRDVLSDPGLSDLTAWVDFSELEEVLVAGGLTVHGLVSQARVLAALGIAGELAVADPEAPLSPEALAARHEIGKLFLPGGMGESIRVLVAARGGERIQAEASRLVRW